MSRVDQHLVDGAPWRAPRGMRGMSLIELMIALVLGMVVVAAAASIFLANKSTYKATETLARVQENSRLAFEMMARDIREARGSACDSTMIPASMLNAPVSWWSDLPNGIRGYENGALAGSAAGTDSLQVVSATSGSYAISKMATSADPIHLTTTTHDLATGDILLLCDFKCATIFQATATTANGSNTVNHAASPPPGTPPPGNSVNTLTCNASDLTSRAYDIDAVIGKVKATRWYIANNASGGTSLYRAQVQKGVLQPGEEVVEGVTDMTLSYLVNGGTAYQAAASIDAANAWTTVVSVRIVLTLQGNEKVNGAVVSRNLSHVVYMRNQSL